MLPLPPGTPMSARDWLERGRAASQQGHFAEAIEAWSALRRLSPGDTHALQQLALATYKLRLPTPERALLDAREMLRELSPDNTNNPETVALWGTIHRRLWDLRRGEDLSVAIAAYERGFLLKQDHFNGTSLAFLLVVRAIVEARAGRRDEAIADRVQAARVRRDLIRQVQPLAERPDLADRHRYWFVAGLWFACLALGDGKGAATWEERACSLKVDDWMQYARKKHAERLCALLAELSVLLPNAAS
jgi:tetratricopeptide (TPR) repeat protein